LKLIVPSIADEQSGTPDGAVIVSAVQKIKDSGITPVSWIALAVLAVTVPLSSGLPVASRLAKVEIRTKKVSFAVVGLMTEERR